MCMYVMMDANVKLGERMDGEDGRVIGRHGRRDELNDNGRRLLTFAMDNRHTKSFFETSRKGI